MLKIVLFYENLRLLFAGIKYFLYLCTQIAEIHAWAVGGKCPE